jgi:hypothetical protein
LTPPARLKINNVSDQSAKLDGDFVVIYNPTGAAVDITTFSLAVGTAAPIAIGADDIYTGIGGWNVNPVPAAGYIAISMTDWGNLGDSANSIKISQTATGYIVDRVEYGTIATEPENTKMTNAGATAAAQEIHRTTAGTDTNSCSVDFAVGPEYLPGGDPPPTITNTVPANGAINVALNAQVVVTFSEAMNTGTVTYSCNPPVVFTVIWSGANTIATYSHAVNFAGGTMYTFQITAGQDTTGNNLVAGAVPNPWTFTTIGGVPPQVNDLIATPHQPTAADIQLEWTNQAGATQYNIYRSTSVRGTGFNFAAPYAVATPGVTKTIWIDTGAYATPDSYSWVVRSAAGALENTTDRDNIGFKLVKSIYIGAGAGGSNNYVGLPYRVNITNGVNVNNGKALLLDIRAYGSPINSVSSLNRFNQDTGLWQAQTPAGANLFDLTAGEAYRAVATATTTYKIVGAYNSTVVMNFRTGAGAGGTNNYFVIPYHFQVINGVNINNSKALLLDIRANGVPTNGASSLNRFNQDTGLWQAQTPAGANLWTLAPGEGYRLVVTVASISWTAPVATPGA